MITIKEAQSWIGREACIHWPKTERDDPECVEGGMSGEVVEVTDEGDEAWIVVDYGYGANLVYVTAIHAPADCWLASESGEKHAE